MSVLQFILITIAFYLSETNDTRMFLNNQSEVPQSEEDSFGAPLILFPTLS